MLVGTTIVVAIARSCPISILRSLSRLHRAPLGSGALRRVRPPRAGRAHAHPRGGVSEGGWRYGAPAGTLLRYQTEMLKFYPPSRRPFEIPTKRPPLARGDYRDH